MIPEFLQNRGEDWGYCAALSGLRNELIEGCLFSLLSLFNPSSLHNSTSDVFPLVNDAAVLM